MTEQATQQSTETKLELTNRLRAEGLWDAACEHRDKVREKHKAAGKTKKAAGILAWQAMATKYPPPPEPEMKSVPSNVFADKPATTVTQDIEWVYQTMAFSDVEPEQAPSGGAWGLLCWVRTSDRNRSEFFRNLVTRILPSRSDHGRPVLHGEDTVSDDEVARLLGGDD